MVEDKMPISHFILVVVENTTNWRLTLIHKVFLWEPFYGQAKRDRPAKTFVDVLLQSTRYGSPVWGT